MYKHIFKHIYPLAGRLQFRGIAPNFLVESVIGGRLPTTNWLECRRLRSDQSNTSSFICDKRLCTNDVKFRVVLEVSGRRLTRTQRLRPVVEEELSQETWEYGSPVQRDKKVVQRKN